MDTSTTVTSKTSINISDQPATLEKDNYADFACLRGTQVRCVLRVLQDSKHCVMSALLLPKLLAKPNNLAKVLTGTKYEPALKLIDDYIQRRDNMVEEQRQPLFDNGMVRLIDYFQRHSHIYKLFPDYHNSLQDSKLLLTFEQMFKIVKSHLTRSAKMEIASERKLHKIYKENENAKLHIHELMSKLNRHKVQLRWKWSAKLALVQICQMKQTEQAMDNANRIRSESERCQRIICENRKICAEKIKVLEIELENQRVIYEKQVKENLGFLKKLRFEKNKFEFQLQAAVTKYDHTIGERMIEHFDLENQGKEEQKTMETLMIAYRKVNVAYNDIVVKREAEEESKKQQRITLYMLNRAANKIQTYWRQWLKAMAKRKRIENAKAATKKRKSMK